MAPRGGCFAVQREATELLWVITRSGDRPASLIADEPWRADSADA
jgi:hypothetical protein